MLATVCLYLIQNDRPMPLLKPVWRRQSQFCSCRSTHTYLYMPCTCIYICMYIYTYMYLCMCTRIVDSPTLIGFKNICNLQSFFSSYFWFQFESFVKANFDLYCSNLQVMHLITIKNITIRFWIILLMRQNCQLHAATRKTYLNRLFNYKKIRFLFQNYRNSVRTTWFNQLKGYVRHLIFT